MSRLAPLEPQALAYDKPLCASLDGFTFHAATRPGHQRAPPRQQTIRCAHRFVFAGMLRGIVAAMDLDSYPWNIQEGRDGGKGLRFVIVYAGQHSHCPRV